MHDTPRPQNAVAAIRVSTTKQGTEGDSPEAQREQIKRYAETRNIRIKKYFEFLESASKEAQPMQQAVDYCKDPKHRIDLLIVKSIDRFTRGGSYSYSSLKRQLDQRNVRLVDLYGIIGTQRVNTLEHLGVSYSWSVYDPTKNSEILEAERASDEKRDIMSRLMGAEIRYTRLGYWMRRAPYGFATRKANTPHGKRVVLIPHPVETQYIRRMFELRARGTHTDQEIVDELNRLGYKSRMSFVRSKVNKAKIVGERGGDPMTCKLLQKYIANTLYAGVNCEKWTNYEPVKCYFDGLISIELFNKANRGKITICSDGRKITRKRRGESSRTIIVTRKTHNYPYRRVVLCPQCFGPFTGSASRGSNGKKYMAYHCNRGGHYFRVPKQHFDSTVESFVSSLSISPEYVDLLLQAVGEEWQKRRAMQREDINHKMRLLLETNDQAQLVANNLRYLRSQTAVEYLERDLERFEEEAKRLKTELSLAEKNVLPETKDVLHLARQHAKDISKLLLASNSVLSKEGLIGAIFDALPTYNDLLDSANGDKGIEGVAPIFSIKAKA